MNSHEKINYVEFGSQHIEETKSFFSSVFGWEFQDFGPDYTAFTNQGLDGGFFRSELSSTTNNGGALIVLYSEDLEATLAKVEQNGGIIVKPVFAFPGGRRFHFQEPGGNELAVWSSN